MTSKSIGPFAQAWYKWKALRLPWRRRFLIGMFLLFALSCSSLSLALPTCVVSSIRLQCHQNHIYIAKSKTGHPHSNFSFQALISKATPSGSSATPAGPRNPASAGAASSPTPDQRTTPRSRSARNGTSGCGTRDEIPRRWRSSTRRWRARRG